MSRLDEFRAARWFFGINRSVQILLAVIFVGAINFIATSQFSRHDMTEGNRFSLSPETRAYLRSLETPVRIVVTRPPDSSPQTSRMVFDHLERLLKEYEYAARRDGKSMIELDFISVFRQTDKAEELVEKYGVNPEKENAIIVASGDRYREILGPELYEVNDDMENLFKGEEAFTSAILEVAQEEPLKIYVTGGHGEMQPDSVDPLRGLSQMAGFLKQRNYNWSTLDLLRTPEIPEDAGAVIIPGPQTALLPIEVQKLRKYLDEQNGRVILLLDPARDHGMDDLLYEWGILADDMLVLEPSEEFIAAGGDMLVSRFAEHPITKLLIDSQQRVLFGLSRPVRPDPGAPIDGRTTVIPLLGSSPDSWAERGYRQNTEQRFDKDSDLEGPIPLGAVSERSAATGLGLDLPSGKLVVFGNTAFLSNNRFNSAANKILFYNLLNWALERDSLLNIAPRPVGEYQLTVSRSELGGLFLRLLWIPGGVAILGFLVYLFRRQ
ncbi:GldG family protein [Rubellicoccus peritrichatus]|uniref:GldG family protein n=1 Tax=Rubellicoccus peritrichatus TaxID=3080537 RepID=A0AAQ3LB50_9BACT|nr:GldG family protein [Puniceicoccus sp. CR14]WOO40675.1 GldG family protein [Puniceicoccus sp. CR14]